MTGGGKTALVTRLTSMLEDAVALFFDDYEESSVMPESFQSWFDDGANYDAFETPLFAEHIQSLRDGKAIVSPVDGVQIRPASYIVVDAPLGRVHRETGKYFDFMVFIDTPLDVAMTRRLLRDLADADSENAAAVLSKVKAEAEAYVSGSRHIYTHFVDRVRPTCDLVLDGTLGPDELASQVVVALRQQLSIPGTTS